MTALLKKISTKSVYGEIKRPDANDPARQIYRVIGQASGYEEGESQFGKYLAFDGIFKAVNFETGEEFTSYKCFLPESATQIVKSSLDSREAKDTSVFKFGFIIGYKYFNKGMGYEFTVEPLLRMKTNILDSIEAECIEAEKLLTPAEVV